MTAESTLRRSLTPLSVVLLLANTWVALKLCLHANAFGALDWLINYQGGFVRRGLLGEILLQISRGSGVSPLALVFVVQALCTAAFLGFSHALLQRRARLLPFGLLILSPFLFRFAIHDEQGSFRKEILFFALLAANAWCVASSADPSKSRRARWALWVSLLAYPLIILTHEMLALYLPILVGLHLPHTIRSGRARLGVLLALLLSATALLVAVETPVQPGQLQAIARTWPVEVDTGRGALGWLADSSEFGRARVAEAIRHRGYPGIYAFVLVAALLGFWPLRRHLEWSDQRWAWAGLALSTAGTVPLLATALDWGRFLNVLFISAFFVCVITPAAVSVRAPLRARWWTIAAALIYASSWHVPHCCGDSPWSRTVLRAWSALTGAGTG